MVEETLNARLRNKVQPLHTLIEALELYKSGKINVELLDSILDDKTIHLLKDLEEYLIG